MVLSPYVRMSDSIKEREEEVKKAISNGEVCHFLYCITMPSNEQNLLDIHPYRELQKRNEQDVVILGLTKNRKEAVLMVTELVTKVASRIEKPEEFKTCFLTYRDSFFQEENWCRKE